MITRLLTAVALAALVGCSGYTPTSPAAAGSGSGSGGYGGGSTGGNGGGAAPISAAIAVGNIFFRSGHNGSANPAVDTVAAGGTVRWTWTNAGGVPHSVESVGSPSFTSSDIETGDGSTYQVTFAVPGTYQYQCAVHGAAMRGTIVVR